MTASKTASRSARIRELRATIWVSRFCGGELTYKQQRRWGVWRASPDNLRAFEEASVLLDQMGEAAAAQQAREPQPAQIETTNHPARPVVVWLQRATCFAALVLTALLAISQSGSFDADSIETHASEWRSQVLIDGSVVTAGPRSLLQIDLDGQQRRIVLKRGEALFHVAKDPSRPFVVQAGVAVAQAVGTEFSVSLYDSSPVVSVSGGNVTVTAHDATGAVFLAAGDEVQVRRGQRLVPRRASAGTEVRWMSREFMFQGETVTNAVAAFNLRNRQKIELFAAIPVRGVTVDGDFKIDRPREFVNYLAGILDGQVVDDDPNVLRVMSAASSAANP